jgi:hypothetical protein
VWWTSWRDSLGIGNVIWNMCSANSALARNWTTKEPVMNYYCSRTCLRQCLEPLSKKTLKEKWNAMMQLKTEPSLCKINNNFFTVQFGPKNTVNTVITRPQPIWNESERHSQRFNKTQKVGFLMIKMNPIFPIETREAHRN